MSIIWLFERVGIFGSLLGYICVGLVGCQEVTHYPPSSSDPVSSSSVSAVPVRSLDHPYTLAILPLNNLSQTPNLQWLERGLQEMLTSDLAKWPFLSVIAREALGPVLREQWLQQRGFSATADLVDLGHLQGVRYLIRGGFHQHHDILTIDVHVVDVETGAVVGSVRAQGPEAEIPRLEQDLVLQILTLFDPPFDVKPRNALGKEDNETPEHSLVEPRIEENKPSTSLSGQFNSHSVHRVDALLSLEQLTQHRMQAYRLAESFWQEGWSAEMGQPFYHVWQSTLPHYGNVPILALPFSVFMQNNKIAAVLEKSGGSDVDAIVRFDSHGVLTGGNAVSGASQLFFEQVAKPRRVFVRALSEQDEVLAVFSQWDWKTPSTLQLPNPHSFSLPLWPQPLVSGVAEFPVGWVEREGQHVTFDTVIVPIPDERLMIVLEPISEPEERSKARPIAMPEEPISLLPLEEWIREKWMPPITEALPVVGYLPGNKRTAVALLHTKGGKIDQVHFHNPPDEPAFVRSLDALKSHLLGYCVECLGSESISSPPDPPTIRLQLTLVKDLHAIQFGARPR